MELETNTTGSSCGIFFAVVGASGTGKDSVLNAAHETLEPTGAFHFAKRVITRRADAGGEAHDSLTETAFHQSINNNELALWWRAHGLYYGLPATVIQRLNDGTHVIANISRTTVPTAAEMFTRFEVVEITALPETISQRLTLRGRENEDQIAARQRRDVGKAWSKHVAVCQIPNDGTLEDTVNAFTRFILNRTGQTDPAL